jgi:16S rRNA (guanine527-N7)-methyltransferase
MDRNAFAAAFDASADQMAQLDVYLDLLARWNRRINLVGASTLIDPWTRHVADSAQLVALAPHSDRWIDLGSGGGLPGIVVAILLQGRAAVTLIEADSRKCSFLRAVRRTLNLDYEVEACRFDLSQIPPGDVVSGRAVAPLPSLLGHVRRFLKPGSVALLPKGDGWMKEVEAARAIWNFDMEAMASRTSSDGVILRVGNIQSVK